VVSSKGVVKDEVDGENGVSASSCTMICTGLHVHSGRILNLCKITKMTYNLKQREYPITKANLIHVL